MRLGLLGHPIAHSLSPKLYRELLGENLASYELIDVPQGEVPTLSTLAKRLDGLSITAPYKKFFLDQITIRDDGIKKLQAINTLSFVGDDVFATNTDLVAVRLILKRMRRELGNFQVTLLGDGSMAKLSVLVLTEMGVPYVQHARSQKKDLELLDLSRRESLPTVVVNSCDRNFIFRGKLHPDHIFWDYNYSFPPHESTIPSQVKLYVDGQEMLRLQAEAAIKFWKETNPKLKC